MFGSFLPSLWSLSNQSLLGSRSRHCYAITWVPEPAVTAVIRNRGISFISETPEPSTSSERRQNSDIIVGTWLPSRNADCSGSVHSSVYALSIFGSSGCKHFLLCTPGKLDAKPPS